MCLSAGKCVPEGEIMCLKVKPVRKKNGSTFPKTWNSVLRERGVTGSSSWLDETDWSFSRVTRTDAVLGAGAATAGPGELAAAAQARQL